MNLQEALEQLTNRGNKYPQEAIEVIREHKEEAKPHLRKAIEIAAEKGRSLDSDYDLFFYAMFLLGEFQDKDSFERMMDLASLPPEDLDYVIGDVVTEGLPDILYNTYNGNLGLLKDSVRNPGLEDFARSAMLDVMGQLYLDGELANGEWKEYLKSLIYTDGTLGETIYTSIVGVICKCHLKDMLTDIRFLYEEGLVDGFVYGAYDDCVDMMFEYSERDRRFCKSPMSVDTIKNWAMFQPEVFPKPNDNYEKEWKKLLQKQKKMQVQKSGNTVVKPKKIGRNEPCPCGSGKKYKHCCLNRPKEEPPETADLIESEKERQKWLKEYPKIGTPESEREEGRVYLEDYYDQESIEIDKLLYLALRYRAVPIWEERPKQEAEEQRKEAYLWQAFTKFDDKMKREGIENVGAYDEKYAIHYKCQEWMPELLALLKKDGKDEQHAAVFQYYRNV